MLPKFKKRFVFIPIIIALILLCVFIVLQNLQANGAYEESDISDNSIPAGKEQIILKNGVYQCDEFPNCKMVITNSSLTLTGTDDEKYDFMYPYYDVDGADDNKLEHLNEKTLKNVEEWSSPRQYIYFYFGYDTYLCWDWIITGKSVYGMAAGGTLIDEETFIFFKHTMHFVSTLC